MHTHLFRNNLLATSRSIPSESYLAGDPGCSDLPGPVTDHRDLLGLGQRSGHLGRYLHKLETTIQNVVFAKVYFLPVCLLITSTPSQSS